MAEWYASYIITGGMYGGSRCPSRDLQILVNKMENHATNNVSVRMEGEAYSREQDYWTWGRAYGLSFTPLRTYIENHMDNTPHEFELFELEIHNPEGAQFYKQSLVFWCSITAAEMTEGAGETDPLKYCYSTIGITRVCRRVYPTPYSPYTDTDLGVLQGGKIANIYRSGIKSYGGYWTRLLLDCYMPLGTFTFEDKDYFGFAIYMEDERADGYDYGTSFMMLGIDLAALTTAFGGEFEPDEEDDPNEDPTPDDGPGGGGPGGEGEQDKHQDPIAEPDLPPLSATAAGFVTTYKLYETNMQTFAKKLFDPDVWSAVKQLFADPMDFICGILILPFSPHTSRSARPILQQVPPIAWDYYYPVIEQQYHIVDCGTIEVPEYYKTALDYSPYTKDILYLPYIGYRELNPDEVQGKTLKIKYHVDVMTGDCVALIIRPTVSGMTPMEQVIAQFSGNCGVHVPFGRQSFDNAIAASIQLISGIGSLAGGVAMLAGGAGGLASGGKQLAEGMIASSVAGIGVGAVNGSKAHVERAGVMGSSAGYMGVQTPYLIRQLPNQSLPDKGYYRRLNGYPCNEAGALREFSGYTAIESIELSGIGATQEEKTEILNMMLGGVIV